MSSNYPERQRKVARQSASVKGVAEKNATLIDGIVNGERVLIAKPSKPSERAVEIQARVAIAAMGVLVMKHTVESCPDCGGRPRKTSGLGKGATDLVCIVPPYGRACFIEMKRPGYSPSDVKPEQKCFHAVVRRFGGVSGVADSVEDAVALVKRAMVLP